MKSRRSKSNKNPKPKTATYQLIPPDHAAYGLVRALVERHHEDLVEARIVLAWNLSWKADVDGRVTLGKCKKASELDRELAPYDFVILLRKEFWQDLRVSDAQRLALLDHELCHAAIKTEENGEPAVDARGRTVYRLRKHDIEEFACIVERHGVWKRDLEAFAQALAKARGDRGWVGYSGLQQSLRTLGIELPLDTIVGWRETERAEVDTWASVRLDLKEESRGLWQADPSTMPACLVQAISGGTQ